MTRFKKCAASRRVVLARDGRWIVRRRVTGFRLGQIVDDGEFQHAFGVDSRSFSSPLQGASPRQERNPERVVGH